MIVYKDGSKLKIFTDKITTYAINSNSNEITVDVLNKQYVITKRDVTDYSWNALLNHSGFE